MSTPFYVSPEQQMKDRADYARKGIARGRSVIVMAYAEGILFVAENPSRALHKISEIYDRIAFAAVGKYNEFENLRLAGVRWADVRGYAYDRRDVTARGLANAYAQTLGTIFSIPMEKPYEVEIVVAEVGDTPEEDQIYRLTYDGSVADEHGFVVMGGSAEQISKALEQRYREGMPLADALRTAVEALSRDQGEDKRRDISPSQLEVAVLDRTRPKRRFKRLVGPQLTELLGAAETESAATGPKHCLGPGRPGRGWKRRCDLMPGREDMPSTLRRSPKKAQEIWVRAHDSAVKTYGEGARAHRTAFAALKHQFEKVGDHWEHKGRKGPSDPQAAKKGAAASREFGETAGGVDANASKEHLYRIAQKLDIKGRSAMTKKELVEAIQQANRRKTAEARAR